MSNVVSLFPEEKSIEEQAQEVLAHASGSYSVFVVISGPDGQKIHVFGLPMAKEVVWAAECLKRGAFENGYGWEVAE